MLVSSHTPMHVNIIQLSVVNYSQCQAGLPQFNVKVVRTFNAFLSVSQGFYHWNVYPQEIGHGFKEVLNKSNSLSKNWNTASIGNIESQ